MDQPNESSVTVLKTVQQGKLQVHHVPHTLYPRGVGPEGNDTYLDGSVVYKLAFIFQDMVEKGLLEFDYQHAD